MQHIYQVLNFKHHLPEIQQQIQQNQFCYFFQQTNIEKNEDVKKSLQNQKIIFGNDVKVKAIWSYKTPFYDCHSYMLYHEYLILLIFTQQKEYYVSLQKIGGSIIVVVGQELTKIRDYRVNIRKNQRGDYLGYFYSIDLLSPMLFYEKQVECDYLQLVRWMNNIQINKMKNNLSESQWFSKQIKDYISANDKKKTNK